HDYGRKNLALFSAQGNLLAFSGESKAKSGLAQLSLNPEEIQTLELTGEKLLVFTARSKSGAYAVNLVPLEPLVREVIGSGFVMSGDAAAFLMNPNGEVLVRIGNQNWEGDPAQHPGVTEALGGQSGFAYMSAPTMEHVVAYSPVSSPGGHTWALLIEEPWEAVDTPYLRLTQFAPLILIPLLAFTLVAIWFGVSQVVVPLQKLEKRAADLAWGNFSAIENPVGGVQEIRQLQHELIHMAQKVQDAQRGLRDYIGAITRGQEDERRRLARELHDETLQALIALRQRVQLAQMKAKDDEIKLALAELETLSSNSIDELRRLTRALRPIYLEDFGLVTALEMLAKESTRPGFTVDFSKTGDDRRLEAAAELTLFRIAQEALSNVSRHAEATETHLGLEFQPATVTLEISDNGKGFTPPRSPAEFSPGGHYGLLGMHERAELIGGKLSIESAPGQGTVLRVDLLT
ncbi:MAG: sensor histidine kinase, partial [Chloroflexi bacterium]|nr:sensor histidine kinase [Chloroflexota bacterium]